MSDDPPAEPARPYATTTLICERVLEERDGTLSFIRVVDSVTFEGLPEAAGNDVVGGLVELVVVVILRSDEFEGEVEVVINHVSVDGATTPSPPFHVNFHQPGHTENLVSHQIVFATRPGVVWFEILLDGALIRRLPFGVHGLGAESEQMTTSEETL